jgi:phosphotriesterase-related protein
VEELTYYGQAGGQSVVDLTTLGIGPCPSALPRIAQQTGLHIVAGTGFYIEDLVPEEARILSEDELFAAMVRDLTEGFPGTGVRAGIIGEIGCGTMDGSDITPFEQRASCEQPPAPNRKLELRLTCIRRSITASGAVGAGILQGAEADLSRVILAHCDARRPALLPQSSPRLVEYSDRAQPAHLHPRRRDSRAEH